MMRSVFAKPSTAAHEFGHFLGLDHRYGISRPSVMEYIHPGRHVEAYDMWRVANLYK
jgi:predicted Zn-dependent protease